MPFRENCEKTLALPSRWPIIDNRNNLYNKINMINKISKYIIQGNLIVLIMYSILNKLDKGETIMISIAY